MIALFLAFSFFAFFLPRIVPNSKHIQPVARTTLGSRTLQSLDFA
jgi:hypothetical protein